MHVAPQMVFLTHTMGGNRTSASNGSTALTGARATPHRIEYIGANVGSEQRMRAELAFLGLVAVDRPLPKTRRAGRGGNQTIEIAARRVSLAELANQTMLHRKVCRLMLIDYCCLKYEFPPACADMRALC